MIPRIFHRIWLGDRPMPDEFGQFGRSWLERHPGWCMLEWNKPQQLTPLVNSAVWSAARNLSQQSDILRYEVLYRLGGVYLDTDFLCQKPLDALLPDDAEFLGAGELPDMLSAGLIGAVPGHPIIREALELLPERIVSDLHQAKSTGPGLLTEAWRRHAQLPHVHVYGPELFYPYAWNEPHRRHEQFPDAYAVHHWAGSWLEKKHA